MEISTFSIFYYTFATNFPRNVLFNFLRIMKKTLFVVAITIFSILPINAQSLVHHYIDSLAVCKARIDSLQRSLDSLRSFNAADSRYYRLFAPLTFYPEVSGSVMGGSNIGVNTELDGTINGILMQNYMMHPDLVETTVTRLHNAASVAEQAPTKPVQRKVEVVKDAAPSKEEALPTDTPVMLEIFKPNFWKFSGDYNLQFMQNHFSANWYKSGEDNLSAVGNVILRMNYNNQQKIKFENMLEMKVGIQTSNSDTVHTLKTTSDLLRYTGKLGLQATKKWYYTFQVIASTQFVRGYMSNDTYVYSDFFSPLEVNSSIGMDYTIDAYQRKLTGSLHIAPIAHNFKHVSRLALSTRYGLPEGRNNKDDWGSQFNANITWKPTDKFKWSTRFYAYTTYSRAVIEWENTFSFAFSRYISAQVFLYPRFDDGVQKMENHSYWQFKEYLSLGFSYSM